MIALIWAHVRACGVTIVRACGVTTRGASQRGVVHQHKVPVACAAHVHLDGVDAERQRADDAGDRVLRLQDAMTRCGASECAVCYDERWRHAGLR